MIGTKRDGRVHRSARPIFPDNLRRDFFPRLPNYPASIRRGADGRIVTTSRSILQSNCHTRSRSFFRGVQRLQSGAHCERKRQRGGPGWRHSRWDPSFLPASGGSRRSFPGIRYAHRSCPQMISSMQLAPACALRYIRSRVDPEKLRRNINAATLIYYRCEECGKRFYYQHLLDYDDILSRIIASQKVNELIPQCAIHFPFGTSNVPT